MAADTRFMALALALGRRGQGNTWPNPAVGCVLVKDGRIVGRGWTQPGGRPHAERVALDVAGEAARGATAYVSLEPCAHHGQTPPCAEALVAAGVARVVAAVEDSDARVAGRGFAILRQAGIDVTTGVLEQEARADLAGFLRRASGGAPHLTLKLATSFDGRIATASGQSQWITGPGARHAVHGLRARHDAVMVGAGTARADDPSLTIRGLGIARQPVRVVVSRRLDLPETSRLAASAREVPLWLCHGPDADEARRAAWEARGARLIPCALSGRQVDVGSALAALGDAGLTRIFCEGGGALAASLLAGGHVDELIGFTAGLGLGAEGLPAIGALGLSEIAEAERFRLVDLCDVGGDAMHRWIKS
ncbi:MAG: bifunctional diaminohydroxyphosphoribosylaminopyrimidine deaminase/5-amino-6-(5-phosphoribosylamino)uracil reductase RibD [Roseovarius sp.]